VRHDNLALVAENEVASTGQLLQSPGNFRQAGLELPGELARVRGAPGSGERAVYGQAQILSIHAVILAKRPMKGQMPVTYQASPKAPAGLGGTTQGAFVPARHQ
jgi:hypothetical protein